MHQIEFRTEVANQLLGPITAWLPGQPTAIPIDPLEELAKIPDVFREGFERRGTLKQDDLGIQRARHILRSLPS